MTPPNVVGPADHTDRYAHLRDAIGEIAGATSMDQLLPSLVKHLPALVNCDRGVLTLLPPAGGPRDVVLFGTPAPPTPEPAVPAVLQNEDPLVLGEAMRRRRRLRGRVGLALAAAEPVVLRSRPLEIRHSHVLSVREGEDLLATIELGREADDSFAADDVALLEAVSHVVSAGLGRMLAREEADAATDRSAVQARRLGVLSDVGRELADAVGEAEVFEVVRRAAHAIIAHDRLSYSTVDDAQGEFDVLTLSGPDLDTTRFPTDGTLVGHAVEKGQPVYSPDLRMLSTPDAEALVCVGMTSALTLPVVAGGKTIGTLDVSSSDLDALNANDRGLLASFAQLMGSALERVRNADRADHTERHDELTGLVNRREMTRQISAHAAAVEQGHTPGTVCVFDVDNFKSINDSFGHEVGDRYLVELVSRIQGVIAADDVFARLGGDQFALLLPDVGMEGAVDAAERVRVHVERNVFRWEGRRLPATVSVGVASVGQTGGYAALRGAETASYSAKRAGRNRVVLGRPHGADGRYDEDGDWVARIIAALDDDRFELFAQPITPLQPGTLLPSFEMLVRMVDDDGELLNPGQFMRVAEDYGLMNRIDTWVINRTLTWMSGPDAPTRGLFNINVSAHSLETQSFLAEVEALIDESGVAPERLVFEITETAALRHLDRARTFIAVLKERGCRFALDDFGSSSASFAALKSLPVDAIKIDGQLVRDIDTDPVDAAAVSAVKALADALGMLTIAEYVESEEALTRLRAIGIDYAQGYHIGRPQPLAFLTNMPQLVDLTG